MAANYSNFEKLELNVEATGESSDTKREFFEEDKRGRGCVKHDILRRYLGAYIPIMAQQGWIEKVIYVDGFAGPGKHENGDKGSPIVAYETAVNHQLRGNFIAEIILIFVELNKEHAKNLEDNLNDAMKAKKSEKVHFQVTCNSFEEQMKEILETYKNPQNNPMLVFADPFGITGIPMDLMQALVNRRKTEVFINVMYGFANRWFKSPKYRKPLNLWLGMKESEWKPIIFNEKESKMRMQAFIKLYIEKLTADSEERLHLTFAMRNINNRFIYNLVFVTGHIKGFQEMKKAMVKYSQETDEFVFSEWVEERQEEGREPGRMSTEEIVEDLKNKILNEFVQKQVSGKEVEKYIWLKTPYEFNVKKKLKEALAPWWDVSTSPRKNLAFDKIQFRFA